MDVQIGGVFQDNIYENYAINGTFTFLFVLKFYFKACPRKTDVASRTFHTLLCGTEHLLKSHLCNPDFVLRDHIRVVLCASSPSPKHG